MEEASRSDSSDVAVASLALMPKESILNERALAAALRVTPRTIRRMVTRAELPPGIRFGGKTIWLAGKVLEHISTNLERAAKEAERVTSKLQRLM